MPMSFTIKRLAVFLFLVPAVTSLTGCSVMAVADAAVTVGATAVKAGAAVVGTAVDVSTAVVKKAVNSETESTGEIPEK